MELSRKHLKNILFPIAILILIVIGLPILLKITFPFVIGFLLSLIMKPIVNAIEKIPFLKKTHASIFMIVVLILLIVFSFYFGFSILYDKSYYYLKNIPEQYNTLKLNIDDFINGHKYFLSKLPINIQNFLLSFSSNLDKEIVNYSQKLIKPTLEISFDIISSFPKILINSLFIVFSTYQFSINYDNYIKIIKKKISNEKIERFIKLKNESIDIFKKWLFAQFKIMFFVWLVLFIGLLIIGYKHAFLMAFLIAFLDFLPAFGVGFIMFPWILISIINGKFYFCLGLVIIYILTQIIRNILQPIFCGVEFGLNGLTTMIAIFIGFQVKGLVGMIFAIPIYMMIVFLYKNHFFDNFLNGIKYFYEKIKKTQ